MAKKRGYQSLWKPKHDMILTKLYLTVAFSRGYKDKVAAIASSVTEASNHTSAPCVMLFWAYIQSEGSASPNWLYPVSNCSMHSGQFAFKFTSAERASIGQWLKLTIAIHQSLSHAPQQHETGDPDCITPILTYFAHLFPVKCSCDESSVTWLFRTTY